MNEKGIGLLVGPKGILYHARVMPRRIAWPLLILLAAAALRLVILADAPPGLTHDEADHGLDAWGVVNGIRPLYFTVGNGREPLFDYATAGLMAITGPNILAGRLTAAFFSLVGLAAGYAFTRRAFGRRAALLAAAGLVVSFWAVMTGRQALRSGALPALFALAVLFYWQGSQLAGRPNRTSFRAQGYFLLAGLFLGATFYTYMPARVLWLLFPAHLVYLALANRRRFRQTWQGTLTMLLIALLVGLPLFRYLVVHPEVEDRLAELSEPLIQAAQGQWGLLWENARAGLAMLVLEGDQQWRYNIAGRPVLAPLMSILFVIGLGLAMWAALRVIRKDRGAPDGSPAFFALAWLALGLAPAMVTGPELSTPRIVGLQPILFLFPALALERILFHRRVLERVGMAIPAAASGILFAALLIATSRDYFGTWSKHPEVRVQYESSLVAAVAYLDDHGPEPAAISTTTPGPFHSPAVALLTSLRPASSFRWFNGQGSLLLPQAPVSKLIFTGFAPLNPHLAVYFDGDYLGEVAQPPTDKDRPLTIYAADQAALQAGWQERFETTVLAPAEAVERTLPQAFGQAAVLLGYDLQTPVVNPGGEVRLVTWWRLEQPLADAVLFTHMLGDEPQPVAQADRLDAPGAVWASGDMLLQLHTFRLPESLRPGEYDLAVGLYDSSTMARLPVAAPPGAAAPDHLRLPPVRVER